MLKRLTLKNKLIKAYSADVEVLTPLDKISTTFGHNPDYLLDIHGITKSDLIRLERLGYAIKARYETAHPKAKMFEEINKKREELKLPPVFCKNGTHRIRWIIKLEVLDEK